MPQSVYERSGQALTVLPIEDVKVEGRRGKETSPAP